VWVFRSQTSTAYLGVIVDISETGIQILTHVDDSLRPSYYSLYIQAHPELGVCSRTLSVYRVWSRRTGSLYCHSGFFMERNPSLMAEVRAASEKADRSRLMLRCELEPVAAP
jgi:hypothetical protein